MRIGACVVLGALLSLTPSSAQQQAVPPPTFRGGTETVQLDVSVLGKDRRPIRGLTAADFTILEDGKVQPVVTFASIDVPDAPAAAPPARWWRDVPSDVSTNQLDARRMVVIVFDDATVTGDLATLKEAKDSAHRVIDDLGPSDVAAVVFTLDNRRPQDFTTDRGKLHAAVERFNVGFLGTCECGLCSIRPLTQVQQILQRVTGQRKLIVYISAGVGIDWGQQGPCGSRQLFEMRRAFQASQVANVPIYSVDPSGLKIDERLGGPVEYLQVMAENTGGRPFVSQNYVARTVPQILAENASYYALGYELKGAKPEGDFYRRLEVKVNRPDVEVRSRTRYYGPPKDDEKPVAAEGVDRLAAAMSGVLPSRDVNLRATASVFAEATKKGHATVAIVLGVEQPTLDVPPDAEGRVVEHVNLLVHAFDMEGRPKGFHTQDARIVMRAGRGATAKFEVLTSTELPPGRYSLRLAAGSKEREKVGSVAIDVEVPKFEERLSLSGVMLSASSAPVAAPRDALQALTSFVPTSQRGFVRTDQVAAFVRVYQFGGIVPAAIEATWRIRDSNDRVVANGRQPLEGRQFDSVRAADLRYVIPVSTLQPGEYLLTLDVTRGGRFPVRRDVRFTIKQ